MEGKEVRFGIANSALFATVTTDASCGAVNSMHDSFMPLGGMVPLVNIQLGEVIFGGVGSGLYGMLAFAIVAMFVAGLMVGRTPEYLGKKLEAKEVKMTILALLEPAARRSSAGPRLAAVLPAGLAGIANTGPHGFSEILYAYTSATGNNGSAFAGLQRQHALLQHHLAGAMLMGRFIFVIPLLAVAGSLAPEEDAGALGRHIPDPFAALRRLAGRRDPHHRRSDLFPGGVARARGRAGRDEPTARSIPRLERFDHEPGQSP